MGPCIVSPRGGIPRVIEGHRGSLYEAQEEAIGYGWLCVKRDFTGKPSFWNLEQFHREIILSGFYPNAGDSLYWKPNRRLFQSFPGLFHCMMLKRRLNSMRRSFERSPRGG